MKSYSFFRSTLALGLTLSLVLNPIYASKAYADQKSQYSQVCDPINTNNAATADGAGDQAKAECTKAQLSMNVSKVEKTKLIMFTAAAVTAGLLALQEWYPITAPVVKAACTALSIGTSVGGMVLDGKAETTNKEIVGSFSAATSQAMSYASMASGAMSAFGSGGGSIATTVLGKGTTEAMVGTAGKVGTLAAGNASKTAVMNATYAAQIKAGNAAAEAAATAGKSTAEQQAAKEAAQKEVSQQASQELGQAKMGCIITAAMLGLQATFSGIGLGGSNSTFDSSIFHAKELSSSAVKSTTNLALNNGAVNNSAVKENAKPGSASTSSASETCNSSGGNEYISCMAKQSPEISAISNNPDFINTMEKALGGKSLGDFAKGFNGDTKQDAANYVGSALGLPAATVSKMMDAQEKYAKDSGAMDKYEPMAYSRAPGSTASVSDHAPDFNSLMAGMLKTLNPDADAKKDNAAELVFRQLDLLPPEKIEQNKEISLFARIGYRYRKQSANLEQLNWSREDNKK